MEDLEGRLQTHPAYDYRGTEERLPTVDQQTFELSRLIVSSYRGFLGVPKPGSKVEVNTAPTAPMPKGAEELAFAAKRGRVDQVEELLQESADVSAVDSDGRTALHVRPAIYLCFRPTAVFLRLSWNLKVWLCLLAVCSTVRPRRRGGGASRCRCRGCT